MHLHHLCFLPLPAPASSSLLIPPQDSTLIMQLLRDNLTLWTSDMQVSVCFIAA
jgi:hypothetical protein